MGTSWIFTASDFFRGYGAGGEIFGLMAGAVLAVCVALAYAELASPHNRRHDSLSAGARSRLVR